MSEIGRRVAAWLSVCLLVALSVVAVASTPAFAGTDDYPANLKSVAMDSTVDQWGFYNRECTSFVAWRLNATNGIPFSNVAQTGLYGNAATWKDRAIAEGKVVDNIPAVGAVAWWDFGHVAWVESVSPDGSQVTIEDYNSTNDGTYDERTIPTSSVTKFLHIGDVSGGSVSSLGPPGLGSKIATARNADGRLSVFYIGANSAIYYRSQLSPGSTGWTDEIYIPAYAKAITAVTDWQGRIELFYIGADNALYHRWQPWTNTDQWSAEERFAANIQAVTAANNGLGKLEVIAIGSNNQLYEMQQTQPGSWDGQWTNIPAVAVDISSAVESDGRVDIFYVGGDNAMYHRSELTAGGSWSDEEYWPSNLRKSAATRNADGRLELFAIGSNAEIYDNWQNQAGGSWAGTWPLIPAQARYVSAATNADGRLEIFYVGENNEVYHRVAETGGWSPEYLLPANVAP